MVDDLAEENARKIKVLYSVIHNFLTTFRDEIEGICGYMNAYIKQLEEIK